VNRRPQYAQTGPCCASSQTRVSTYALRLVGVEVSWFSPVLPPPRPLRLPERFRAGFVAPLWELAGLAAGRFALAWIEVVCLVPVRGATAAFATDRPAGF
jgi:hypothetical protein